MKKLLIAVTAAIAFALTFYAQADTTGNWYAQVFASAVQTGTTVNSSDMTNAAWRGADVIVNVSAYTSGTYTPHIQGKDPVSGNYYDILVGPAISATGTTVLHVYPGVTAAANSAAAAILPYTWRVQLVGATTPSMTLSVGANLGE